MMGSIVFLFNVIKRWLGKKIMPNPLSSGEIFDPEREVKKILKLARKDRVYKLKEFKNKLAYQRVGLVKIHIELDRVVHKNLNLSFQEAWKMVSAKGAKYGMSWRQRSIAKSILRKCFKTHSYIRDVRKKYPNDAELYAAIFGKLPEGYVKVFEWPTNLYFYCLDIRDYAFIYQGREFWEEKGVLTEDHIENARRSNGVMTQCGSHLISGLENALAAGIIPDIDPWGIISTFFHEEQHSINALIREHVVPCIEYGRDLYRSESFRKIPWGNLLNYQQMAEEHASDEILAYFKSDDHTPETMFDILIKDPDYSFLDKVISQNVKLRLTSYFGTRSEVKIRATEAMLRVTAKMILTHRYYRSLRLALDSLSSLKNNGFSKKEIIAVLIYEPLARWAKVSKRLIKGRH